MPKDPCGQGEGRAALLEDGARDRILDRFERLAEAVAAHRRGRRLVFMGNVGNRGDALIYQGTLSFFRHFGIEVDDVYMLGRKTRYPLYARAVLERALRTRRYVYAGSGAWSRFVGHGGRIVAFLDRLGVEVLVLPTTFDAPVRLRHARLFARDLFQSIENVPSATFCHDMAFFLAVGGIDQLPFRRCTAPAGSGRFFRTDDERSPLMPGTIAPQNDLSASGSTVSPIAELLEPLDAYEEIVTDRLHIAIAGLLLGKRVAIVPGGYFKIRAIYESSIRGNFRNAELVEERDLPARLAAPAP